MNKYNITAAYYEGEYLVDSIEVESEHSLWNLRDLIEEAGWNAEGSYTAAILKQDDRGHATAYSVTFPGRVYIIEAV